MKGCSRCPRAAPPRRDRRTSCLSPTHDVGNRLMAAGNRTFGYANHDAADTRGWLVGHFLPPSAGVRTDDAFEVKWANHPVGDTRQEWTADDQRTTLVM